MPVLRRIRAAFSSVGEVGQDLLLVTAAFWLCSGYFFYQVFASPMPGGWDGMPHYAIAGVYSRDLFPAVSGWTSNYFGGMPFPNFYPPLFYMLVAGVDAVGPSTASALWIVQALSATAVPLLLYLCARELSGDRIGGLLAAAIGIGFMLDQRPISRMGITLEATFGVGLSTQLLGFCFLLGALYGILRVRRAGGWAVLTSLCLAAVPLSNVHVVWPAALVITPIALVRIMSATGVRARLHALALHAWIAGSALALAGVWLVPMLLRLDYVPTFAMDPPPTGAALYAVSRLGIYLLAAVTLAWWRGDRLLIALAVGLAVTLVFSIAPLSEIPGLSDLAIQPGRVLIAFEFLAVLPVGYVAVALRGELVRPRARAAVAPVLGALFLIYLDPGIRPDGLVSHEQAADYEHVLSALPEVNDGRVLVEMGTGSASDGFGLQALVGLRGAHSLTTVFRESAINVFFAVPLRNTFSRRIEEFGVDAKLDARELKEGSPGVRRARLDLFNVRYLALHTIEALRRVTETVPVEPMSSAGRWRLYRRTDVAGAGFAIVPHYLPVLTFARFTVKPRPDDGLDWIRLGEEMFLTGRLDLPLVHAGGLALDEPEGWERFGGLLLIDYQAGDREAAFRALADYARERPVVAIAADDPLCDRLRELATARDNVVVIESGPDLGRTVDEALTELRARVASPATEVRVVESRIQGQRATIELSSDPQQPLPIWIRQGYFPNWRTESGQPVYMATPTFQLTFATARRVELEFRPTTAERIGGWSTIAGFASLGLVVLAVRRRRRRTDVRSTSDQENTHKHAH